MSTEPGTSGVRPLRLATFNLRHGRVGEHWPSLPWRIAAGVRMLDADVVGLQEVDQRVFRSWFVDQAAVAARAGGATDHAFALARPFGPGGRYGNALAVRGWVTHREVVELPRGERPERRVVLLATVESAWLRARIAVTHLQNHHPDALRQLAFLAGVLGDDTPAIVMGDLNLHPDEVGPMLEGHGFTLAGGADSSPVDRPHHRIDHIAVRGLALGAVDVPRPPVSDHRPVIATVTPPDAR